GARNDGDVAVDERRRFRRSLRSRAAEAESAYARCRNQAMNVVVDARVAVTSRRPPAWLLVATGILALTILGLSVAETSYSAHWLIDQGDYVSIIGLVFIACAGMVLYRQRRLFASLPLIFPWLLYPVITQGDQLIDNMSINTMRVVCDVLLAAIFA